MAETEVEIVERLRAADVRDLFPTTAPDDADARVCLLCATSLKDKTHNLTRHLERRHAAALLQLMAQRTTANATAAVSPVTKPRVKSSKPAAKTPNAARSKRRRQHDTVQESDTDSDDTVATLAAKQEEEQSARRALVRWLAREQLPISLVESDAFRVFTRSLNDRFGALASGDVQKMLEEMQHDASTPCTREERIVELQKHTLISRKPIVMTRALVATARTSDDASSVCYQQLPCGPLSSGCVRVRVCAALATHWDASACKGQLCGRRGVLGRTFVGVVVQTNERDASVAREQQRVALGSSRFRFDVGEDGGMEATGDTTNHLHYFGVDSPRGALTQYIEVPKASVCELPSTVPDDLALLTSDLALVLRIGSEVKRRGVRKIAITAAGVAGCLASLLVRYVHQELGLGPSDIRIVAISRIDQKLETQLMQHATINIQTTSRLDSSDTFPLVVDMGGTDTSANLAVCMTEPMGTLLMVDCARFEATNSVVAMDMNAVVVNELEVVAIGDCSSAEDAASAVAYLRSQTSKKGAQELRALLSAPVALDDALEELRALPLEALQAQYLLVKMTEDS